jgi:hypothetical protein
MNTEKYLLALKCLLAAHSIEPPQSKLHEQLVRFRLASQYNSHLFISTLTDSSYS